MLFTWILLRHSHRIKVEVVIVGLREPNNCLVTARKAVCAVQAVLEMPDDAIPHPKLQLAESRIKDCIERDERTVLHVVAHLPADAPRFPECANAFATHHPLLLE